jgi:Zn-dependent protease
MAPASPDSSATPAPVSRDRLWAEQLAMGAGLFFAVVMFMAVFHPLILESGFRVLGPNYLDAYGWASAIGILLQLVVHEAGTFFAAWRLKLPLRFRLFAFGANATAILEGQPRRPWIDAVVGFAGPVTGSLVSVLLAVIFSLTYNPEDPSPVGPLLLGMACVGYFYNLFTLIPVLDLEGGWIAPAIAPQFWLVGVMLSVFALTEYFNLVLLGVLCFAVPRLFLLIRARAPREDLACTNRQRIIVAACYLVLVLLLAMLSSWTFDLLPRLVTEAMSD